MQFAFFSLIVAVIVGSIVYAVFRIGEWLHNENRGVRLWRGLALLFGTIALGFSSYVWLSDTKTDADPLSVGLFIGVPLLAVLIAGVLAGLHLLLSGPKADYLP